MVISLVIMESTFDFVSLIFYIYDMSFFKVETHDAGRTTGTKHQQWRRNRVRRKKKVCLFVSVGFGELNCLMTL